MSRNDDSGDDDAEAATDPDDAENAGTDTPDDADATTARADATDERVRDLREQVRDLRADLREFEADVEERTLHRDEVEHDLERYVRARIRRGHARGWGPYLVLLYGTAMTIGAFFYLSGVWAILAMVVVWLSTLGLYALMLIVGAILGLASVPGRLGEFLGRLRGNR